MMEETPVLRTIVQFASRDALPPMTVQMLDRLGYRILMPADFESIRAVEAGLVPDLLLVDERRLAEVSEEADSMMGSARILMLSGRQGATGADPRIVGAVKRPAGMHDLYRLMQQVFVDTPRSNPRVATQLRARCASKDTNWEGRVLSLSENGCLIRTSESMLLGQQLQLELVMPHSAPIAVEAEATYQLLPDTGLVFHAVEPANREALNRFISQTILSA